MERMVEQIPEQAYHQYHNFLSESKWDYQQVNNTTALETSVLLSDCKAKSGKATGYIIDESSLKTNNIKKVSFGDIYIFLNSLMLRHH
jgi:hypothetical protein